jgi:hypothetical protein
MSLDIADVVRDVSKTEDGPAVIEQPDCAFNSGWAEVHIALRRAELLMASEFLNRSHRRAPHRQMRTERVPQYMYADIAKIRSSGCPSHKTLYLPLGQRTAVR